MDDLKPIPAPHLNLPTSSNTVCVRAIDTTARLVCDARAFVQPGIVGHEKLNMKTMCFLLEHKNEQGDTEHVLFDCGSRKDFWNGSPQTQRMIGGHVPAVEIDYGVDEILTRSGFDLANLKSIVWSHWHWDHIGDGSKFPGSTDIVVGPGFTKSFVPGWPTNPHSFVLASDLEGHFIHEPDFTLTVAGFPAVDYFGDGSFYLLDVPGHALGHICGLARTTPDTFVFMGGDCCHYAGMLRPTRFLPLPRQISTSKLDSYYPTPCPCSAFTKYHPATLGGGDGEARTNPFYQVSRDPESAYSFGEVAQESIHKLQAIDAHPSIFIALAHDCVLFDALPLFNDDPENHINDWKHRGLKELCHWSFLNELPKDGKPAQEPLVIGLRRAGKVMTWNEKDGFVDIV